jgi:hypothetical protein
MEKVTGEAIQKVGDTLKQNKLDVESDNRAGPGAKRNIQVTNSKSLPGKHKQMHQAME